MTPRPQASDPALAAVLIEPRAGEAGALLPLLHDLQAAFGYVPVEAKPLIAAALTSAAPRSRA